MIKEGAGHHPHSLRDPKPIADFISQHVQPAGAIRRLTWPAGTRKSSFYGRRTPIATSPRKGSTSLAAGHGSARCFDRYSFN